MYYVVYVYKKLKIIQEATYCIGYYRNRCNIVGLGSITSVIWATDVI